MKNTMIRKIPEMAFEFISKEEGCILHPYRDAVGFLTIGVGHLIQKGEDFSGGITMEQARELFDQDIKKSALSVCRLIKVTLTENQYLALIDFVFNLGGGALQSSTLRSKLNRGEYVDAAEEFQKWCWAGGKKLRALYNRMIRERNLFLSGESNEENS